MIVSEEGVKDIIHAKQVSDIQMIALIRQYIFDKKGQDVEIQIPRDHHNAMLMHVAFERACEYYCKKYDA